MTNAEYQAKRQRIWQQARNYLIQTLSVGNANYSHSGIPNSSLMNRGPYAQPEQGLNLPFGRMPSDADITKFVQSQPAFQNLERKWAKQQGGGKQKAAPEASAANLQSANQTDPMALFNQLFAASQAAQDQAKYENLYRYYEGKGELGSLRDRNQERVGNWGYAAQADIDERLQEQLGNTKANLAARGMSNSSIGDAFAARAARDTAREQQRVSEMRDSRMAEYDSNDTNNLVGFIERRNDVGPDYTGLMSQAMSYAQAEANRQAQEQMNAQMLAAYRGNGGRGRSNVRLPVLPGPQGGVYPMFLNGSPGQMASAMMSPGNWGGISSNRYPTRRSPQEYAAIAANQAALQQQAAQRNDMNAWYNGRRSMLPNYGQSQGTYA